MPGRPPIVKLLSVVTELKPVPVSVSVVPPPYEPLGCDSDVMDSVRVNVSSDVLAAKPTDENSTCRGTVAAVLPGTWHVICVAVCFTLVHVS